MLLMGFLNLRLSNTYPDNETVLSMYKMGIYVLYIVPLSVIVFLAFLMKYREDIKTWSRGVFFMVSRALVALLCIFIFIGFCFSSSLILGDVSEPWEDLLKVFIFPFSIFLAISIMGVSGMLLRSLFGMFKGSIRTIVAGFFSAVSAFLIVVHFLPVCYVPEMISESEKNFTRVFGPFTKDDCENKSAEDTNFPFMEKPFSLTGYFLGIPHRKCRVIKDTCYFNGKDEKLENEKNIELYFDTYLPRQNGDDKRKKYPVLIRIHGGGWIMGDKGRGNMMQMNPHFASKGYAVFDIQYGLKKTEFMKDPITPEYVKGDFDMDDIIRQLGYFTKYLIKHADKYNADLDTVFISGGSAGGQLTCALGLGIAGGKHEALFGKGILVKGIIPYYPANKISRDFINGSGVWGNPEYYITKASPPALVFQGLKDRLVHPDTARSFAQKYKEMDNPVCCVLYFPYAGHAADLHFPGFYNRIFLYHMERFMVLYG